MASALNSLSSAVLNKWTATFDFPESFDSKRSPAGGDSLPGKGNASRNVSEAQGPRSVRRKDPGDRVGPGTPAAGKGNCGSGA